MADASREPTNLTAVPMSEQRQKLDAARAEARRAAPKTAVLVLGMHCSGGSDLARVLNLLGCDLPKTNSDMAQSGSDAIAAFNETLLASAGSSWCDWRAIHPGWRSSPKAEEFKTAALQLLEQKFGASRLFVLKDPRICRLLPLWLDVLEAAGVHPALVMPTRNPLDVAASLAARDGLDPALGQLVWLRHVLDAEAASRGRPRLHCSYGALLAHWPRLIQRAEETLAISFPRAPMSVEDEVGALLDERRRQDRETRDSVAETPNLSAWIRDAFEVFDAWAERGEDTADYATLDRIGAAFDSAAPAFAKVVAAGQRSAETARRLEQEVERLSGEQGEARAALARLTAERVHERAAAEARIKALEAHRDSISARMVEVSRECERLHDALEEQRKEAARLAAAQLSAAQEAARLRAEAQDRAQLQREHEKLQEQLAAAAREIERLEAASNEAAAREDAERQRELLEVIASTQQALAETRERLAQTEARLDERFGEIATLTRLLRDREAAARAAADEAEWIRRVAATLLAGGERWRGRLFQLLPGFVIRAWVVRHLKRQRLFDGEAYLRANPDVARARIDALRHYIHHGMKEGRART